MTFHYLRQTALHLGTISTVYPGSFETPDKGREPVVIKISNQPGDKDLLMNEATVLRQLAQNLGGPWSACVPKVYDSFDMTLESSGRPPRTNILSMFPGFLSVADIRELMPGVDARTMIWMWKRLLGLLEWVHGLGYVHGAILPHHILYYPDNNILIAKDPKVHSVRLVDWCYSIPNPEFTDRRAQKMRAWLPAYSHFYPEEVYNRAAVGPWTDIYMAAKVMIYLLGGNPKTNHLQHSSALPWALIRGLSACISRSPAERPSASQAYNAFVESVREVYTESQFHEFIVPGL